MRNSDSQICNFYIIYFSRTNLKWNENVHHRKKVKSSEENVVFSVIYCSFSNFVFFTF